jgi:hypothetical protein
MLSLTHLRKIVVDIIINLGPLHFRTYRWCKFIQICWRVRIGILSQNTITWRLTSKNVRQNPSQWIKNIFVTETLRRRAKWITSPCGIVACSDLQNCNFFTLAWQCRG